MKRVRMFALVLLVSPFVCGQSALTGSCQNGGTYPNCSGGEIVFSASGYSGQPRVLVTNSSGEVIDNGQYTTSNGVLRFVENLSFADTYTISINGVAVLTVTTN